MLHLVLPLHLLAPPPEGIVYDAAIASAAADPHEGLPVEIGPVDGAFAGKRMIAPAQEDIGVLQERPDLEIPAVGGHDGDAEFRLSCLHAFRNITGGIVEHAHRHSWEPPVEDFKHARQDMHGHGRQTADRDGFAPLAPLPPQGFVGGFHLVEHAPCIGQKFQPGVRQRYLSGRARQELEAEVILQLAHAVAERRL